MAKVAQQPDRIAPASAANAIGVAIIGAGYWGPNLIRNFSSSGFFKVNTVCDWSAASLASVAMRYPGVCTTSDLDEVLKSPAVDAIAIATPTSSHYTIARQALLAGKHVWVEKPLALTRQEGEELTDLADRNSLVLLVDHTFIYSPAVQAIRSIVDAGELGELLYYDSVRVNLGRYRHDVNVIWDLAVHDISIMDYLLPGQPVAVTASGASHVDESNESIAYLTFQYPAGLIAHCHVNWLAPVKTRLTTVCGRERMLLYEDTEPIEKVKVYDRGIRLNAHDPMLPPEYHIGDIRTPILDESETLQIAANHFAECIRTGSRPLTDGAMGTRVVAMAEAAQRSLREGGSVRSDTVD
jgi:predicted dehydrogenase